MAHQMERAADAPELASVRDGRFEGSNEHAFIELRIDSRGTGLASADVYRLAPDGSHEWVASARSAPGTTFAAGDAGTLMIAEDELGGSTGGRLTLSPTNGSAENLHASLQLDAPLNGLPGGTPMTFTVQWMSSALREVKVETETEEGVEPLSEADFHGRPMSIEAAFLDAGVEISKGGHEDRIPAKPQGWDVAGLHTLMQDFSQESLEQRSWALHLLLLGQSDQRGLLGVMFDDTQVLPRQGAAVFAKAIRSIPGIDHSRKLIQTSVHELGHALNLAHRFERVVARADSSSFMNYDWRYKGGDKADEFWERFAYAFDPDELSFLRHGPRPAVIPGGAAFHSSRYWSEGTGGYSPYVREAPLEGFALELQPALAGRLFAFAQPIFLEITLRNLTGQPIDLPPGLLDPKGGVLEILIRKTGGKSTNSLADVDAFQPILQRCFDLDSGARDTVPDGGSISNNINLTYGSSGFHFADPGAYEVTALLAIYDSRSDTDFILRSPALPIRVAAPQSVQEDRDAMELFRDDVGVYLALGGNRNLEGAHQTLQEFVARRAGETGEVTDPVAATIVRAQALDARRDYVRFQDGRYRRLGADEDRAAGLLDRLGDTSLQAFDAVTAEGTKRLAASYRSG
jgi:hypothetical protein